MSVKVGVSKSGPRAVATPPERPQFVLGSRPPNLRDFPIQRTEPLTGQRNYGKATAGPRQANPAGLSSGSTFQGGF